MADKSNFTPDEWKLLLESMRWQGLRSLLQIRAACGVF